MTCTVNIAKNVYGGDGLGRLGDGRVVFVPGAWVGERVKAELVEQRKGYVKARLVEIEEASPERLAEPGPAVPGMVYAHLSPKGEEQAKAAQLEEFLARARLAHPPIKTIRTVRTANYRNKVVYHFENGKIGYREEPGHTVVDMAADPLALPEINAALPGIRRNILAMLTQGASAVRKAVADKGKVTIRFSPKSGVKWWLGEDSRDIMLLETTCGRTFEVSGDGFYQVNPEAGELLAQEVALEYRLHAERAPNVLDLYCGVGVLGVSCDPPKLTGIESGRRAIDCAKRNAAQIKGETRFFSEEVGRNLRRIAIGGATCVIVDPPRGGLEKGVPEWLGRSRAPVILYVRCDPATLVRDLRPMVERGYAIESVKWLNMFPRTARFETLVALVRP